MKYINEFEKVSDFQAFMDKNGEGGDALVSYIVETQSSVLKPYVPSVPSVPALAGDVAYWDGSKVKTTPLSEWDTSLGTAIGVVVVPTGFAPDGKARIISLKPTDEEGNPSDSYINLTWGRLNNTDTSLTNYTKVPTTDNASSTSTGSNGSGYLPSDSFSGATSFVDPKANYNNSSNLIPSPYLGDKPNPEYYKTLEGGNALSDFNGLRNTQTLVDLSTDDYLPAYLGWKYKDGSSNLQWYLPAMGELGYLIVRNKKINNTITALGGIPANTFLTYWSSSEINGDKAYAFPRGFVGGDFKYNAHKMRPFAMLE